VTRSRQENIRRVAGAGMKILPQVSQPIIA
jgi:hypothetical protein